MIDIPSSDRATHPDLQRCGFALVGVDDRGRITGWTPSATSFFGFRSEEMIGAAVQDLFDEVPPLERWIEVRGQVVDHAAEASGSAVLRRNDGSCVAAEVTVQPVLTASGTVDHVDVMFTAVDGARGTPTAARIDALARTFALDDREIEVLSLLASGHRTATIAPRLHLARGTVRNLLSCLYVKLGVASQIEVIELLVGDGDGPGA